MSRVSLFASISSALLVHTLFSGATLASDDAAERTVRARDVALAEGYVLSAVAKGLAAPSAVAFDDRGRIYVLESGLGVSGRAPRLLRIEASGRHVELARGLDAPWTDVVFEQGAFYIAAGDVAKRGNILKITMQGQVRSVRDDAPGLSIEVARERLTRDASQFLSRHPELRSRPTALFGVVPSASEIEFSRNAEFGYVGNAFAAQFRDFKLVRIDAQSGVVSDFAINRGKVKGPASLVGGGGLERPVAVRFDREGKSLYIVDFGVVGPDGAPEGRVGSGVLWRIDRVPETDEPNNHAYAKL